MTKERIVNNQIADLVAEIDQLKSENERLKAELLGNTERLKGEREWISVETELPEIGQWVLTYVPSIDMICRDQYRHFEGINKNDFVYKGVSHWMPLPQPPKQ